MDSLDPKALSFLIVVLVSVLGYLLRKKDVDQEKQIAILFRKHDEDVEKLRQLELQIAVEHYRKTDLDPKFEKLEGAIKEMSATLGGKFDRLTEILVNHVRKEDERP